MELFRILFVFLLIVAGLATSKIDENQEPENVDSEIQNPLLSTLKSLKCVICDNILSVAPIVTITSEENQCGRCKNIKYGDVAVRNTIFENVAQHLNFPCMNKTCTEMLPWKDVENHEKDCVHTSIVCPLFHENCEENITLKDLKLHILKEHGNNVFFEKIQLTVAMFKSFVCLGVVGSMEFLIYINNDKVLITSIKPIKKKLTYTLKLNSPNENTPSLIYENQSIEGFDERKHCFRCLDKRCDKKNHPFSTANQPKSEENLIINDSRKEKQKRHNSSKNPVQVTFAGELYGDPFGKPLKSFNNFDKPSTLDPESLTFSNISPSSSNVPQPIHSSQPILLAPYTYSTQPISATQKTLPKSFNQPTKKYFQSTNNAEKNETLNTEAAKPENPVANQNTESSPKVNTTENHQLKEIKCTSFNLTHVQNLIGVSPSIIFTITVSSSEEEEESDAEPAANFSESYVPRSLLSTLDNTDLLRKIFECPICNELMLGKIFVCENGHQICSKCKEMNALSRGATCPSCMGVLMGGRSIALETLAEECSICCCYKKNGCEYRGNLEHTIRHECVCELRYD